jgi:DNA-binding NarL/FixJ family response regulator
VTAPRRPRVVIIDDSTVIRDGFAAVHPQLDVCGTFAEVEEFEEAELDCDVVLLDLLLHRPDGTSDLTQGRPAIRLLRDRGHAVCLYTDERRPLVLALCLRAGASGVVHKSDPTEATVAAVCEIAEGRMSITQSLIGLTELLDRRDTRFDLSPRQRQVVSARARGQHWLDIAAELYISEDTAREHYQAACQKLRDYLQVVSPGDIEHAMGLGPGDILDED